MSLPDALARRNTTIVDCLVRACDTITQKRADPSRERRNSLVKGMFGSIDDDQTEGHVAKLVLALASFCTG